MQYIDNTWGYSLHDALETFQQMEDEPGDLSLPV